MDLDLEATKFSWKDFLLKPGCILTLIGLVILLVSIGIYSVKTGNVDYMANPEQIARPAANIKIMVWMVGGIVTVIAGAFWSFLEFARK